MFTPYARAVDVAEPSELVPGDLVFDDWDRGDFELINVEQWKDVRTLHLEHTG